MTHRFSSSCPAYPNQCNSKVMTAAKYPQEIDCLWSGNIVWYVPSFLVFRQLSQLLIMGRNTLNGWAERSKSFRLGGIIGRALYPSIANLLSECEPLDPLLLTGMMAHRWKSKFWWKLCSTFNRHGRNVFFLRLTILAMLVWLLISMECTLSCFRAMKLNIFGMNMVEVPKKAYFSQKKSIFRNLYSNFALLWN